LCAVFRVHRQAELASLRGSAAEPAVIDLQPGNGPHSYADDTISRLPSTSRTRASRSCWSRSASTPCCPSTRFRRLRRLAAGMVNLRPESVELLSGGPSAGLATVGQPKTPARRFAI
jgi:hypothetical protein